MSTSTAELASCLSRGFCLEDGGVSVSRKSSTILLVNCLSKGFCLGEGGLRFSSSCVFCGLSNLLGKNSKHNLFLSITPTLEVDPVCTGLVSNYPCLSHPGFSAVLTPSFVSAVGPASWEILT